MSYRLRKLRIGFRNCCPNCELGKLYDEQGKLRDTCPYCHSRFERVPGELFGAVYLNMAVAELMAVIGFLVLHTLFSLTLLQQFIIWIPGVMLMMWVFAPRIRGVWIAALFLMDRIYPDPDYDREYINPHLIRKTPQEHE